MRDGVRKEELEYVAKLFSNYMKKEQRGNNSSYEVRDIGKLESSITQPFQKIGGRDLYPTFTSKAAMLYYLCIKNHPFEDGNKRMGIFALTIYLAKNGYWLDTTNEDLFNMTVKVAASSMKQKDQIISEIQAFIKKNIASY
jgi:death-on-curing protein